MPANRAELHQKIYEYIDVELGLRHASVAKCAALAVKYLESSGLAIVPLEATDEMGLAAHHATPRNTRLLQTINAANYEGNLLTKE